ncbi:hypothetical protein DP037_05690 [Escherichia coli]|nr:hypothetical protein [Escherichia coli]
MLIISLAIIIKSIRIINECNVDSFLIRTFRAKGILLKVKNLAQWLDAITFWQRNIIFFAIFILGYLIMII